MRGGNPRDRSRLPIRVDRRGDCIWQGDGKLRLTGRASRLLAYLVDRSGRLVSKHELLDALWPNVAVADGVLKVYVAELRKALSDSHREPAYIETVHGRGYRFIGPVTTEPWISEEREPLILERDHELRRLRACLERCSQGHLEIACVTGDAGIGKTALMRAFAAEVRSVRRVRLAQGQCLDAHAGSEPFFPLLEALSSLARTGGIDLPELLRQHAPTWLAQLPSLQSESDQELLRRQHLGASQGRLIREFVELLAAIARGEPLVLILEDLHWADSSTRDLIGYLARKQNNGACLLLITFRPGELDAACPLRGIGRDPGPHAACHQLPLAPLSRDAVETYLGSRFPGSRPPGGLAETIRGKTGGNPLFVVSLVDYMLDRGELTEESGCLRWIPNPGPCDGVPETVRDIVERQIAGCGAEARRLLEAASLLGLEFPVRLLAETLDSGVVNVAALCAGLSREPRLLEPVPGACSAGAVVDRYRFVHELMLEAVRQSVDPARRVELHRRVAALLEKGGSTGYADLARHLEAGMEWTRAIECLRRAAGQALSCGANREAIGYMDRAIRVIEWLPDAEQPAARMGLLEGRGLVHQRRDDIAAAVSDFAQMAATARTSGSKRAETQALLRSSSALFFADHERCLRAAETAVETSQEASDPGLAAFARGMLASSRIMILGWDDREFQHCAAAAELARSAASPELLARSLGPYCILQAYRSEYAAAAGTAGEAAALALDLGDLHQSVTCQYFKAWSLLHLGQWGQALALATECLATAEKNDNALAIVLIRLLLARMHTEAHDYRGARAIARRIVPLAENGIPRYAASIALLFAEADSRSGTPREIDRFGSGEQVRVDWLHTLTLRHALSRFWLRRGNLGAARSEATALVELASRPPERTYVGLGRNTLAEVAIREGDWRTVRTELAAARRSPADDLPLANWRLLRTAAVFARHEGRDREADDLLRESEATLLAIAHTLDPREPLRRTLVELARAVILRTAA